MTNVFARWSIVIWGFWLFFASCSASSGQVIPRDVREKLGANAAGLNGLELRFSVKKTLLAEISSLPKPLQHLGDPKFLTASEEKHIVRIGGGRLFQRVANKLTGIGECAFDGESIFSGRPDGSSDHSILSILTKEISLEREELSQKHFFWCFFPDAGFWLPSSARELGKPVESLVLRFARQGKLVDYQSTNEMIEVRFEVPDPWQVKEIMSREEIERYVARFKGDSAAIQRESLQSLMDYSKRAKKRVVGVRLDLTKGYACTESWEETEEGQILSRTTLEDFSRAPKGELWLPRVSKKLIFSDESAPTFISPKPILSVVTSLDKIEQRRFSEDDFRLWYKTPGGMVFDYTAEGATLNRPVASEVPGELRRKQRSFFTGPTFWIFLNLLLIFSYIFYRRR